MVICLFGAYPITRSCYIDWYLKYGVSDSWNDWHITMYKISVAFAFYAVTLFVQDNLKYKALTTISLSMIVTSICDDIVKEFEFRFLYDLIITFITITIYYKEQCKKYLKRFGIGFAR